MAGIHRGDRQFWDGKRQVTSQSHSDVYDQVVHGKYRFAKDPLTLQSGPSPSTVLCSSNAYTPIVHIFAPSSRRQSDGYCEGCKEVSRQGWSCKNSTPTADYQHFQPHRDIYSPHRLLIPYMPSTSPTAGWIFSVSLLWPCSSACNAHSRFRLYAEACFISSDLWQIIFQYFLIVRFSVPILIVWYFFGFNRYRLVSETECALTNPKNPRYQSENTNQIQL
jgi:hypothetical protein